MLAFVSHLLDDVLLYAGLHPWYFILCSLLCLAPFFAASVYLSRQLANNIDVKLSGRRMRLDRLLESFGVIDRDETTATVDATTASPKPT